MNPDKQIIITALLEKIKNSPFMIVADYAGMTVPEFEALRGKLRESGASFHVTKNTFIKRATNELELPQELSDELNGQSAIVTGESDVCAAAKALKDFNKTSEKATMKAGVLDGALLTSDELNSLASLPSREVLLAQLLGVLEAPASKLVRTLAEPGASLARVLAAKKDQG